MNKIPSILTTVLLSLYTLTIATYSIAQTYRWVDHEGVTHFSQEAPNPADVQSPDKTKLIKPNPNQISEKEDYLENRAILEQQISGTINDERRDQLKRQLLVLDYQWYQKYDPEKAAVLSKQLETPKVRVIKKADDKNNMDKYKAYY